MKVMLSYEFFRDVVGDNDECFLLLFWDFLYVRVGKMVFWL